MSHFKTKSGYPVLWAALLLQLLACGVSSSLSESNRIEIESCELDEKVLSIDYEMVFNQPATIYMWRGHMYPVLDRIFFAEARSCTAGELMVERVAKVLPKVPHPDDVIIGEKVRPQHSLKLAVNSGSVPECIEIRLRYSTLEASSHFEHLSRVSASSNWFRCTPRLDRDP